jgi:hypothetical protein
MENVMSRTRASHAFPVLGVLSVLSLFVAGVTGQTPARFCENSSQSQPEGSLLEIRRLGRGMISPTIPQLFIRVLDNGLVEYETYTGKQIILRKKKLQPAAVLEIRRLMEAKDLVDARQEYPLLEDFKDALMKTCVTYKQREQYQHVLLINYTPMNPKAEGYYPPSLMKLLGKIEEIRPKTKYEHRYRLDKSGLQ